MTEQPSRIVDGLRFVQTCEAFPEQYEVFDAASGVVRGYVRLRHGDLTVNYPDVEGDEIFYAQPDCEERGGEFKDEAQRTHYLEHIAEVIQDTMLKRREANKRRHAERWAPTEPTT